MGLILAGILAAVVFLGICVLVIVVVEAKWGKKPIPGTEAAISICALALFVGGVYTGIRKPVSGYEEPKLESTTELVCLRDEGTTTPIYLSISDNNSYTYLVVDDSYISNSQREYEYKTNTISSSNVKIIEDDNCDYARLETYVRKGKKTFWTFAAGAKQYEYVFYVPKGTSVYYAPTGTRV